MKTLKSILNLTGENPLQIILGKNGEAIYEAAKQLLTDEAEPALMEHLAKLNIRERLQDISTIEGLETVEIEYVPMSLKELIADTVDKLELTLEQKLWLFTLFLASFYNGATAHINQHFNGRAKQIQENNKPSIITL